MPAISSTKEELQERIKELSCLYEISSVFRSQQGENEEVYSTVCQILQRAWRFPEKAIVDFRLKDYEICTGELPSSTVSQVAEIHLFNEVEGCIKVHYPHPQYSADHFLPEEQKLLKKVADEISAFQEKQLQKEQEELLKRSAQRNDRLSILGEITAGIAHELNTPLGNILGFAELINERTENDQTRKDTSKIIKAAIFSREVVKKLMFFACEMPQNMKVQQVEPIIVQALSLLGPNFRKAQVEYDLQIQDPELQAQFDPIQLTQVLFNLLINALYLSPVDSRIEVKVYSREEYFFIEIADEGPGIKEEHRSRIFEPFFTTKPVGEGSGLGLSVVHGIVKSHRGEITTFDNEPQGAVFRIKLPLKM